VRAVLLAGCAAACAWSPPSGSAPAPPPAGTAPGDLQIVAVGPYRSSTVPSDPYWTIFMDGAIDGGAVARLVRFVEQQSVRAAAVYLNSSGGSLLAAIDLGRTLRRLGYDTHVGARLADAATGAVVPGFCYSACPFAFAGGVRRHLGPGSVLGVHRAVNRTPVPDEGAFQRRVTQQLTDYLAEMGIHPALVVMMSDVPREAIRPLSLEEATQLQLVTDRQP
jgi:hypothetical protein